MEALGTTRPGGRTAKNTAAVLAAAIEELSERDYADISVESIAARAGVHKTTVYRRWGSKVEVIRQAMASAAVAHIHVPDTGNVDSDLLLLARAVQAVFSAPQGAAITRALIVGSLASAELAGIMRHYWAVRLEAISVIVDRAVSRGELSAGTDPAALMRFMSAPLFYQLLVAQVPVTEEDANLSSAATMAAAKSGAFTPTGTPAG